MSTHSQPRRLAAAAPHAARRLLISCLCLALLATGVAIFALTGSAAGPAPADEHYTAAPRHTPQYAPPRTAAPAGNGIPAWPQVMTVGQITADENGQYQLCQCSRDVNQGVDCSTGCGCGEAGWGDWGPIPWEVFAQGEYVGPARTAHVPVYRIRVDDRVNFIYRRTREEQAEAYRLIPGDTFNVQSFIEEKLDEDAIIQPDGTITLPLLGQVRAAGRTVAELNEHLEELYGQYYNDPTITVTPLTVNTRLEDLLESVNSPFANGGYTVETRVTPAGTVQLTGLGSIPVQGLTIDEIKREVNARYDLFVQGVEIQPILSARAPRFVYVLGEVFTPGRFELEAPTTVMQAIALAGGWNNGGNLREIVVFRRSEDWQLMATRLDLRGALLGERPCPSDEIWVRDSDLIVVPKSDILRTNDFIELVFTRGIYGVVPFQGLNVNFAKLSTI